MYQFWYDLWITSKQVLLIVFRVHCNILDLLLFFGGGGGGGGKWWVGVTVENIFMGGCTFFWIHLGMGVDVYDCLKLIYGTVYLSTRHLSMSVII